MSIAIWRPDLATGIPEIDLQHEQLIANVSSLRSAAHDGDVRLAEGVLQYLEQYAAEHFAAEERAMWQAGYPDLDAHWSLHLAFATELARRRGDYRASTERAALLADLGQWMDGWLEEHVLGADAQMARFLRGCAHRPQGCGPPRSTPGTGRGASGAAP